MSIVVERKHLFKWKIGSLYKLNQSKFDSTVFKSIFIGVPVEVEHVQDCQFCRLVCLWTRYNGCHIQLFSFPDHGY